MFRCTECNEEYEIKPDFCDCGNDVFEEIVSPAFDKEEKIKPKKSFGEMYPSLARLKESLDPISVIIFSLCIVLSILSLIFIGNKSEEENVISETKEVKQIKIKDIDEIWDDTPAKVVQEKKAEPIAENKENTGITIFVPKIEISKKTTKNVSPLQVISQNGNSKQTQKTTQNKQAAQTQTKNKTMAAQKPKTTTTTTKPATTTTKPVAVITKTQPVAQKTQTQTNTTNNVQLKPTISNQTNTQKTTQAQNDEAQKELKIYKNSLRNLLFSKINFAQIEGDGIGIVSFKVESNGKLTGKTFVQRSNNEQLDDAIFYALNTTSSYKTPPSSYKGETLRFKVKFIGGQYEVSLN